MNREADEVYRLVSGFLGGLPRATFDVELAVRTEDGVQTVLVWTIAPFPGDAPGEPIEERAGEEPIVIELTSDEARDLHRALRRVLRI